MDEIRLTPEQLEAVVAFAAKFSGYTVALSNTGDGRVLVRLVNEHGQPAGEKLV